MEMLTLAHLDALRKPIVIFNQDGYYDHLLAWFDRTIREGFMHETIRGRFALATTPEEVFSRLENWQPAPAGTPWYQTK
jgi:predicted Rossmann-fold nucleotide-binding protein